MKVILEHLWQLQGLDRKIIALREAALFIPDLKAKQEELARIRLQEQEKKKVLDDLRLSRGQTNASLESCRQRLMKAESAVKDIKSPEVFQATIKEIDQLKKFKESLELKEVSIRTDAVTVSASLTDLENRRVALESEIENSSALKKVRDKEIESAVQEVEAQKAPIQCLIPPKYLFSYQRIAGARGGIAVVQVCGSSCAGCNMILPAQFVNELSRSKAIEQCPNCKRILVVQSTSMVKQQ
ncbi:C4-type zinc ribbon domain-containing protein [Bdellovibrionota bacterium FG-1]